MEALVGITTEIKLCDINVHDIEIEKRIIDMFKHDNRAMANIDYEAITKAEVIITPDTYKVKRVPYDNIVHSMGVNSAELCVTGTLTDGTENYDNSISIGVNDFVFINSGENMF